MRLAALHFVAFDGAPPPGFALDELPSAADVCALVLDAFSPFCTAPAADAAASPVAPADEPVLVYCYGHAWLDENKKPCTATVRDGVIGAGQLFSTVLPAGVAIERAVIVLDCCYAAAFDPAIADLPTKPWLVVYASGAMESAISLASERASRLSLAFRSRLSGRRAEVDVVGLVGEIARTLDRNQVIQGQSVSYRMNGPMLLLSARSEPRRSSRERAVARIRNAFIGAGAIISCLLIAGAWYYIEHALVEIDLGSLQGYATDIVVSAAEQLPEENAEVPDDSVRQPGGVVRLRVHARDLIIRIEARFNDGARRALAFHLDLRPGIAPGAKMVRLALPSRSQVERHPDMAFVPAGQAWYHGRERALRRSDKAFWIDIAPPTQSAYLAEARRRIAKGDIRPDEVLLLRSQQRSDAVDATGLQQLRGLNKDLGAIFGAIEKSASGHVAAGGDVAAMAGGLTCPTCPAIMFRTEAEAYCKARGMRLPTDLEWELAVRGVDGRDYPWGNRFDSRRANVPGLPDKGAPSPSLKPVDAYRDQKSPFGLIDTVGNAGDWVRNESGSYESVYMGATYRFEPEDATAFRMLPVTDADLTTQEITARCAVDP